MNKNSLPGDDKPWLPTGIRIGTPAVTTLGMVEEDMRSIGLWIARVAAFGDDEDKILSVRNEVESFMAVQSLPEEFVF